VPQPAKWHPEIDTGVHVMMALRLASRISDSKVVRFAVLMHDLGKAITPAEKLPSHPGHEQASVPLIEAVVARLKIPNEYRELALMVARHHGLVHRSAELRPATVLKLLEETDAVRRPERFTQFLLACEADARGRAGLEERPYPQADYLRHARDAVAGVTLEPAERDGLSGAAIGEHLRAKRLKALTQMKAPQA
jgi:tRNA nucleotidyltransferase (CCA-adding enzyme)